MGIGKYITNKLIKEGVNESIGKIVIRPILENIIYELLLPIRKKILENIRITKLKIRELAVNNNYIPNSVALALKSKRTKTIAVIVPHINSPFYSGLLSEIQKEAFNKGYKVLILQSFGFKKRESECINEVMDGCVDGIVVIKSSHKRNVISSCINGIKFPSSLIYVEVKSSMSVYDSKFLGEESLKRLLQQIN